MNKPISVVSIESDFNVVYFFSQDQHFAFTYASLICGQMFDVFSNVLIQKTTFDEFKDKISVETRKQTVFFLNLSLEYLLFHTCNVLAGQSTSLIQDSNKLRISPADVEQKYLTFVHPQEIFDDYIQLDNPDISLAGYNNKAIILDIDNTIRFSVGQHDWPEEPSDVRILPGVRKTLIEWQDLGYRLLGASNQSCISRGVSEDRIRAVFEHTFDLLGLRIDYLYCPHQRPHPYQCWCRKPLPGMGAIFIHKYKLDRKQCLMIGDAPTDKLFAESCGFRYMHPRDFFKETIHESWNQYGNSSMISIS